MGKAHLEGERDNGVTPEQESEDLKFFMDSAMKLLCTPDRPGIMYYVKGVGMCVRYLWYYPEDWPV